MKKKKTAKQGPILYKKKNRKKKTKTNKKKKKKNKTKQKTRSKIRNESNIQIQQKQITKEKIAFYHIIKGIFCTNAHSEDGHEPLYVDDMVLLSVSFKRNSPSTNESSHQLGQTILYNVCLLCNKKFEQSYEKLNVLNTFANAEIQ